MLKNILFKAGQLGTLLFGLCLLPTTAEAATYVVTNTSADRNVSGSLPWAVFQANYTTPQTTDFITFNISGGGQHTITLNDTLYINDTTVIDGKSQPGYSGEPLIFIKGSASTPSLFLLQNEASQGHTSSGSTVQGLGMYSYTFNAITIFNTSQGNWIQDNWLGFYRDPSGNTTLTNQLFPQSNPTGVGVQSSFNTIRNNTIAGVYNGMVFGQDPLQTWDGTTYKTNSISGNKIGTDPTGATSEGYKNTSDGVFLGAGARETFIGPDNVISGNDSAGVEFLHPSNIGNVVFRNRIGTNDAGTAAIPNKELGILFTNGATGNAIGGPFGGNVISCNSLGGIAMGTSAFGAADSNWIQFNTIGLNGAKSGAIAGCTQNVGISLESGSKSNPVQGNVIGGHTQHGIVIANSQGNNIDSNWIGQSDAGVQVANQGFGVALLSGGSFNFVQGNFFGSNALGPIFVDPNALSNAIQQ